MRDRELTVPADDASHLTWVRTRLTLDKDLTESIRYGFSLIAAVIIGVVSFVALLLPA
jgi:hypothetical protein